MLPIIPNGIFTGGTWLLWIVPRKNEVLDGDTMTQTGLTMDTNKLYRCSASRL